MTALSTADALDVLAQRANPVLLRTERLPIEMEAIAATAEAHLRDPEELAAELSPVWAPVGWTEDASFEPLPEADFVTETFSAAPTTRSVEVTFQVGAVDRDAVRRLIFGPGQLFTAPLGTPPPGVNTALTTKETP